MSLLRNALLAASESHSIRHRAMQLDFVKRSVARFMPGERIEDALGAVMALRQHGIGAVLTELGENVTDASEAERVTDHYRDALARIHDAHLDCDISVKPTQLGLTVDHELCYRNLCLLVERATRLGAFVWIDMEQHAYVEATLALYRRAIADVGNVGVCLQAYLYRTADDLASLIPLGGGIRLVKGAYREPPSVAYPKKRDVDLNFMELAKRMIGPEARSSRLRAVFGTHDRQIIRSVQEHARATSISSRDFEFHLLFGIQRAEQVRLVSEGYRVRVLISYGAHWFPWYMRRLAERPANMVFLLRSLFS